MTIQEQINAKWDEINYLVEVVGHNSDDDALKMLTVLHEVAKIHAAGLTPKTHHEEYKEDVTILTVADPHRYTADRLFRAIGVLKPVDNKALGLDEDGIPL